MSSRLRDSQRGFSLLEVLVAFTILALALTALYQIFGKTLHLVGNADAYRRAVVLAESRLAEATAEDEVEREAAGSSGAFTWRVTAAPYRFDEAAAPDGLSDVEVQPLLLTAEVRWGTLRERRVVLNTVRYARLQ